LPAQGIDREGFMSTLLSRVGRRFLPIAKRFDKDEKGVTAVEFALVSIPFFACFFAIIEVGLVFFAGQVLETAVGDAGRLILTGQAQAQNFQLADFKNRICTTAVQTLFTCTNIAVDVRPVAAFNTSNAFDMPTTAGKLDTSGFGYTASNPCDIVVVRVIYEWPTFVYKLGLDLTSAAANGSHKHILMSTAAFRNEPFSSGWCASPT
jgi:Flp pilus assembly protein TadG